MAASDSLPWPYRLYHTLWLTIDWVFPPECVGCGKVGARICEDCLANIPRFPTPLCAHCGNPLPPGSRGRLCRRCREISPAFDAARSWAPMEGIVRTAIHRLKYHNDLGLAEALAAQLLNLAKQLGWQAEGIIPIPLGRQRHKERGYNQAALLAFPLALGLGVPYLGKALTRARETRSQVGLDAAARRRNVAGAFSVQQPKAIAGKAVLLVDDVMTTGATLDAAAQALKQHGARSVFALTVARAVLHFSS